MVRDPRPVNDLSRMVDSVFKPRDVPGSRRGRFLIVFAAFLVVEAAFVVSLMAQGSPIGVAGVLWGVWLLACVVWIFVPQFGAATDQPGNQRIARNVALVGLAAGLVVSAAGALGALELPQWWLVVVASAAVGASSMVLGILEIRRRPTA